MTPHPSWATTPRVTVLGAAALTASALPLLVTLVGVLAAGLSFWPLNPLLGAVGISLDGCDLGMRRWGDARWPGGWAIGLGLLSMATMGGMRPFHYW